jgi:hypothetical protein
MAFDLSTPTAQLAFGVAQRAQEVQDYKTKLEAEARARVEARLAPYGNDLSQFDSTFKSIYDPAVATQQSRAKAMQEYVVGLPELLARAKAERSSGSGGGGGAKPFVPQPYVSPEDFLNFILGGQGGRGQPIAVQKDLGGGMTYGNVGGYGAVYPTGSKGPTVRPVTQQPTRGIGWDGKR